MLSRCSPGRAQSALRAARRISRQTIAPAGSFSLSSSSIAPAQSAWAEATETAHSVVAPPHPSSRSSDPLEAISNELGSLKSSLFQLLGSSHPSLDAVAKYYFQAEGKHLRPLLVLLISQATNGLGGAEWEQRRREAIAEGGGVDNALTQQGGVLNDWNPESMGSEKGGEMVFAEPFTIPKASSSVIPSSSTRPDTTPLPMYDTAQPTILPTQRRLASITEMIHVASLLHDDVIDNSPLRRGAASAPSEFGNKLSILSGDFLLGRASVALARLGSREVVELLATVIANLVEGEVMQMRATSAPETEPTVRGFESYMRKTYLKTASLMAKSARAAVILGGCEGENSAWVKDVAYGYGRNLGIAFQVSAIDSFTKAMRTDGSQLVDDMLDYLPASPSLGKPSDGADLRLGLATAPALFAWQQHPSLGPLILRKFEGPGDVELARDLVDRSDGLLKTRQLAEKFAKEARDLIRLLPESSAREELERLTWKVVERVK